jgi:hypothetical protein
VQGTGIAEAGAKAGGEAGAGAAQSQVRQVTVKFSVLQSLRQQTFGLGHPLHDDDIDVATDVAVHDAMLRACEPVQASLQARQKRHVQGQLPKECVKALLDCGVTREPLELVSLLTCADIGAAARCALLASGFW